MTLASVNETFDADGLVRRDYFDANGDLLATTTLDADGNEQTVDPSGNPVDPATI